MKAMVMIAMLALSSQAFAAGGVGQFFGRYTPEASKGCEQLFGEAKRVYIGKGKSERGPKSIDIGSFGEDASGMEILLGRGQRQAPGTSVDVHGEVTQSWNTKVDGATLTSVVKVVRPSIRYYRSELTRLVNIDNEYLVVTTKAHTNGKKTESASCKLLRY